MPFNFIEMKKYTVNYVELKKTLLSYGAFLTNKAWQEEYIGNWIKRLEHLDDYNVRLMDTKEAKIGYIQNKLSEPEVFQIPVYFPSNTLWLHFRTSPLLECLSENSVNAVNIPLCEFLGETNISWSKEPSLGKSPLSNPIIIIPFPLGKFTFLVIDGNHRLSMHVEARSETVSAYALAGKSMIDADLFACGFDKYLYAMILELQCAKECFDNGMSDMEILSRSILYAKDGKFHFEE